MGAYLVHKATVRGSQWKAVTCRSCQADFAYLRTAQANAESSTMWWNFWKNHAALAKNAAMQKLDRELAESSPVRCPACGRFQLEMFDGIRRRWFGKHAWKPVVAALLVVVAAGLFGRRDALTLSPGDFVERFLENIFNLDLWLVVIAAGAVGALVALRIAAGRLDPNVAPERWSGSKGWTRPEYERSRLQDSTKPALVWASDRAMPSVPAMPVPATPSRDPAQPTW